MRIIVIIIIALLAGRALYHMRTQDTNIQGYFEHLKEKYWKKKE